MSNTNDFNSATTGSSSNDDKTYPDNVRRMPDVSTLSSEAQSSGMTMSAVSSSSLEPRIAAPSIHSSTGELDSTVIGATQVILSLSVRLLSTTPGSEEDNMVRAKYEACSKDLERLVHTRDFLRRAMSHAVPTAWTGAPQSAVFDPSVPVSVDVKHCLKKFQDVMFAYGLDPDQNWLRLLPPCLSSSQHTWLDEHQEKEDVHTWSHFKKAFTGHYGVRSAEAKATSTTELLRISMTAAETVDQYIEHFNNLYRLAQIQDRCVLTRCFLIGLQADIYKKVIMSLANCTDVQKESVDYVVKLAKTLYHSLYKVRRVTNTAYPSTGPSMVNDSSSSGWKKSSAFVSGSATRVIPYPRVSKKYCSFHKTTNHSNHECRAMKKPSSSSPSSGSAQVDVSSGSAASQWNPRNQPSGLGRPCRSCGADNWRPGHRCKGKGRSTGSSLSSVAPSSGNDASVSVGSSATPTASSSNASSGRKTDAAGPVVPVPDSSDDMDIDVAEALAVAEAAQACKYITHYIFSKAPSNINTLYAPIIIEHIKTWAMIDTSSSFSCVPPLFCLAFDLVPTSNPGSFKYCKPPNETPVGTMQERQHLMSTIQPLLDANTSIPVSSHRNLPGAVITLDTEPNALAYRRQPDIAIANRKIMEDQIQTWLDDCVIEPAPSNTRFNNPTFLSSY
ncbi:hypothetical protein G6F43_011505 [Rhizopus delemar]|nr:hypothetical protein G6F43_011505 [Rhizopus delemar]